MLAASPFPVTRPIRAQMDWIAAIKGKASGIVQSMLKPELRAGLRVSRDAARIVVGDAGDQARPEASQRMDLQAVPKTLEEGDAVGRGRLPFSNCHQPSGDRPIGVDGEAPAQRGPAGATHLEAGAYAFRPSLGLSADRSSPANP